MSAGVARLAVKFRSKRLQELRADGADLDQDILRQFANKAQAERGGGEAFCGKPLQTAKPTFAFCEIRVAIREISSETALTRIWHKA